MFPHPNRRTRVPRWSRRMWQLSPIQGRIVLVRVKTPFPLSEFHEMRAALTQAIERTSGRYIGVADLRGATVIAPEVADALIAFFSVEHPRLLKSALLLGDNALLILQVTRILRTAATGRRRGFTQPPAMLEWLHSDLHPAERAQLAEMFAQPA